MIQLTELDAFLKQLYQVEKFSDYCPNGIQVEGSQNIDLIATAVSASLDTIEQTVNMGAQALIVHHGLFWNNQVVRIDRALKKKLKMLLDHNISLLAYHLPMDAHLEFGNNYVAAKELGFSQLVPFAKSGNAFIGVLGESDKQSVEIFSQKLESYFSNTVKVAGPKEKEISRVGFVSGGGHRFLEQAIEQGLDAFVTGTADEPTWHLANENGIVCFSVGHSASERVGPKALANLLKSKGYRASFISDDNPY